MATTNRQLFRPLDILFPIGIFVILAAGCFLIAGFANTDVPGRIVTALTGVAALGFIFITYWVRYVKTKHDYKTRHGLYVVLGKKNRPTKQTVEEWTESVILHWSTCNIQKPNGDVLTRKDVLEAINNLRCFFCDTFIVTTVYRIIRGIPKEDRFLGYAFGDKFVVGYTEGDDDHECRLFRHEESHPVLRLNGFPSGGNYGDNHHNIFKQTKLGA